MDASFRGLILVAYVRNCGMSYEATCDAYPIAQRVTSHKKTGRMLVLDTWVVPFRIWSTRASGSDDGGIVLDAINHMLHRLNNTDLLESFGRTENGNYAKSYTLIDYDTDSPCACWYMDGKEIYLTTPIEKSTITIKDWRIGNKTEVLVRDQNMTTGKMYRIDEFWRYVYCV